MIDFEKTTLPNGLTLLTHQERNTSLVSVNILYNVGARDENPDRTGFAHLFEHLMF
ncbi:MAG: insulinase family protein, partial [Bacteroidales bacterium]|nr:insulinase family protein [Bacteroidales bacterium]